MTLEPRVSTCLWFDGEGEEAAGFYTSLLPDSRIELGALDAAYRGA